MASSPASAASVSGSVVTGKVSAPGGDAVTGVGVVSRSEVDDARGGERREPDDPQPRASTRRPAGFAEEHDYPVAGPRRVELRVHLVEVDRIRNSLQAHSTSVAVLESAEPTCEPHGRRADEHVTAMRTPAEPCGDVQRRTAKAPVLELDCLARVDPHPDLERDLGVGPCLVAEPRLQIDRGADGLPRRGEAGKRLVAAELDELPLVGVDPVLDQLGEFGGEARSRFVTVLLRVPGVPPDVGDEEGAESGLAPRS